MPADQLWLGALGRGREAFKSQFEPPLMTRILSNISLTSSSDNWLGSDMRQSSTQRPFSPHVLLAGMVAVMLLLIQWSKKIWLGRPSEADALGSKQRLLFLPQQWNLPSYISCICGCAHPHFFFQFTVSTGYVHMEAFCNYSLPSINSLAPFPNIITVYQVWLLWNVFLLPP